MEITKLSSKGQIVIPKKIREALKIDEGSVLMVEKVNDMMVVKKMEETSLEEQIKKSLEDIKHGRIKEWKG